MPINCASKVLVLSFLLIRDSLALYEGDKCSLKDGSGGTCKLITECPTAVELLKNNEYPIVCGFVKNESIVCCQNEKKPSRTPGDISKQKCKEYAQYVYEKIRLPTLLINPHYAMSFECGLQKVKLVVGNTVASTREFPHMVQLGYEKDGETNWQCGGSILSENFVLTAAHCVESTYHLHPTVVRVGIANLTDLSHVQEITISEWIVYPEYRPPSKYHDIALLKLSKNVQLNSYARPACLQTEKDISQGKPLASGWGVIGYATNASDVLLKVALEFLSVETCNTTYRNEISRSNSPLKYGIVDDWMICAGITTAVRNTCQGDSGGPLQVYHEDTEKVKCMYDIVGVISFGKPCIAGIKLPGIYTRVSNYIKWIEDTVWPN